MNNDSRAEKNLHIAEIHNQEIQSLQEQISDARDEMSDVTKNYEEVDKVINMINTLTKVKEEKMMWKTISITLIVVILLITLLAVLQTK